MSHASFFNDLSDKTSIGLRMGSWNLSKEGRLVGQVLPQKNNYWERLIFKIWPRSGTTVRKPFINRGRTALFRNNLITSEFYHLISQRICSQGNWQNYGKIEITDTGTYQSVSHFGEEEEEEGVKIIFLPSLRNPILPAWDNFAKWRFTLPLPSVRPG